MNLSEFWGSRQESTPVSPHWSYRERRRRLSAAVIYASPVSLTPRHYAIGLYQNTLSRENMLATRRGVLQVGGLAGREQKGPKREPGGGVGV